jgi:putative inorganic carbon (hco3(-)) transporter
MRSTVFDRKPDVLNTLGHPLVLAVLVLLTSFLYGFSLAHAVSPLWLIAVPMAAILTGLAFVKPEYAAVALLGITWGYISEIANKYHGVPSITKPLVGLLLIALIVRRFTGRRVPFVYDHTIWWMIAYFFVICLGLWYAPYPNAVMPLAEDFAKDLLLFLVIINLITSLKLFERSMWLLLAIGALLGTLTVYQEITHSYDSNFGGLARMKVAFIAEGLSNRPRAAGTTGEPLAYGQQLLVLVPIGLWALLHARTFSGRVMAGYATVACLAGIGLSFSRSTYIALAVVLVLFALYIRLNPRYLMLVVPLVGILLLAAPPEFTARFSTLSNLVSRDEESENQGVNSEGSFRRRSVEMLMAVNMFADHPILGVGGGNYRHLYPSYIREHGSPVEDAERDPHSFYLEVAAEHGILGLTVWGGILILTWNRLGSARKRFYEIGEQRMAGLAAALQIGFAGYLVSAIFLHGVYARFLWLQVSMAVAFSIIVRAQSSLVTANNQPHESLNQLKYKGT